MNPSFDLQTSAGGVGRLPWKHISIALALLFSVLFFLYLLALRKGRRLRAQVAGIADENQSLKHQLDATNQEFQAAKRDAAPDQMPAQLPEGYRIPIINPGLKFNIQPVPNTAEIAFCAWNSGETLRVLAVLDSAGKFGDFRSQEPDNNAPAWVLQLYSAGEIMLKETYILIQGSDPDGKKISAEIRALLESSLSE